MKKASLAMITVIFIFWLVLSCSMDNSILLPGPFDVISSMILQFQNDQFFTILFLTSIRTINGCLISLVLGGGLGILAGNFLLLKNLLYPVHQIIKTIPNITYMILILIWLGQENSVTVIVFFILFPIFYAQFLNRTEAIKNETDELLKIYPVSAKEKLIRIDLPMLIPDLFAALKTGIGMGFKVCVMAEILGQVKSGIGRQMNYGRLNLDIASVFAWTIWLILLSYVLQKCVDFVQKIINQKIN